MTDANLLRWSREIKALERQIAVLRPQATTADIGLAVITMAHRRADLLDLMEDELDAQELAKAKNADRVAVIRAGHETLTAGRNPDDEF